MDAIDYLTDNLINPSFCLFNSKINKKGIAPELCLIIMGYAIPHYLDLVDRDNNLVCQVDLSPFGVGGLTIQNELYLKQKIELPIIKNHYEFSIF